MRTTIMRRLDTLPGAISPRGRVVVLMPETLDEKQQGVIPHGPHVAVMLDGVRVVTMAATSWPLELYALQHIAGAPGRYIVQARVSAQPLAPGPFAFGGVYTSILEQPTAYPPLPIGAVVEFVNANAPSGFAS